MKGSFCVFIFVASYYLYILVQCGIIIVPVSCDCSVSLCGTDVWNPDVSKLQWLLYLCSDFSKEMPWQVKTCKCVSECCCSGVFFVNEGETSKLAIKKSWNISMQKNKGVFHGFRSMEEFYLYTYSILWQTSPSQIWLWMACTYYQMGFIVL